MPPGTNYAAALEYCIYSDLQQVFSQQKCLDEATIHFFFKQILEGVNYLHLKGIAHRDLKLENIYVTDQF